MVAITKLISYIIPIVVLILFLVFYYNPQGSFEKVKTVVSGIIGQVSVGAKQTPGEKPVIPAEQQQAIDNLKATIVKMSKSDKNKNGCFGNYNPSFSLGGGEIKAQGFPVLGGTSINILQEGKKMRLTVFGGADGRQEVSSEIVSDGENPLDVTPCVISGRDAAEKSVPLSFYQKIIIHEEPVAGNFFLPVEEIVINRNGNNKLSYNKGANINFDDGGFLCTPDGQNICFFPTKNGNFACDGNDNPDGLDDDCLGEGKYSDGESIPHFLYTGALTWC